MDPSADYTGGRGSFQTEGSHPELRMRPFFATGAETRQGQLPVVKVASRWPEMRSCSPSSLIPAARA
jgi:hypothetical protein